MSESGREREGTGAGGAPAGQRQSQAEDVRRDPDFPLAGHVRYELIHALGESPRCAIRRVEYVAICEDRAEARQWMLDRDPKVTGEYPERFPSSASTSQSAPGHPTAETPTR